MLLSKGRTKPTLNNSACDFKEKAPDPMFKKNPQPICLVAQFFGESEEKKRKAPAVWGLMHRLTGVVIVGVLKHRTLQPDTLWLSDIVFGENEPSESQCFASRCYVRESRGSVGIPSMMSWG